MLSGVVLWWRRRDQGVLGRPEGGAASAVLVRSPVAGLCCFGVYLPLFGASLVAVFLAENVSC